MPPLPLALAVVLALPLVLLLVHVLAHVVVRLVALVLCGEAQRGPAAGRAAAGRDTRRDSWTG